MKNANLEKGRARESVKGLFLVILAVFWFILAWGILPTYLPESVSHWLERYGDIAPTPAQGIVRLLTDQSFLISRFTAGAKWAAVARVLWPVAFLPLLAPSLFALALPVFAYLMISNKASVSQFQVWYVAPLLPVLFVATAMVVCRAQLWMARLATAALVVAGLAAYFVLGAGPLAAGYEPARFAITDRTNCAHRILQMIPPNASVSAQDNLLPHLAHRATMHVFPSLGDPPDEYVVMDTQLDLTGGYSNWPTIRPLEVPAEVNRFLARPTYSLIGDGCDYKILRYTGDNYTWSPVDAIFGQQIQLKGYELAVEGNDGIYRSPVGEFRNGDSIRVTLWWQANGKPQANYTIFVHALNAAGQLAGQHDSPPANGYRPTGAWSAGELIKDIHYLKAAREISKFSVGLYDARNGQRLVTNAGLDEVGLP